MRLGAARPRFSDMERRGTGFGLVMLVVVMAVVLLLVARSWRSMAPAATAISDTRAPVQVEDHGESGAGAAVRSGDLPDLQEMREETRAHSEELQETMQAIE